MDWNNDFFFGAAEGLAYEWSGDYEKTLPITIPIDAPPGDYRMRVRGVFSYTAGDPDPCDNYYLGSTVDFTLSIVPSRSCLFPEDLIATNIGVTSADISWTPKNGETMWNVIFGESGFDPLTEGSTISVSNIPALALTQLSANTIYDVYLRAICATNDESFLTFPMSFRTECGITTVPYSMDFETSISPNLPLCTSAENNGVGNDWKTRDSVAEFIGGMLYYSYHTTNGPANSWFFTQGIELQASKTYNISFIYANSSHDYTNSFKVAYGTSPTEASMATQITDIPTFIGRSPKDRLHTFSVAEDGVYYFGFNVYSRPNQGGLYIDDINIVEVPRSGYVYENNVWSPENPSGISSSLDNITVINGTAELSANTSFKNLTIKQGATLNINKVVRIYGDLIIYGDLVFVSNAIRNAELRSVSSTTNITGDITVESYMSSNRSYRMVSSAVTTATSIHDNWQEGASSNIDNPSPGFGTHITGTIVDQANGFDRTASGNPSMFTVNTAAQAFVAVTNTDINTLDAGTPYLLFVRGDRSTDLSNNASVGETVLRAKGRLHIGPDTQTFNTVGANHFVMFGNPYQSAVNINNVFTNSTNLKTGQYYVYDPNLGDHGSYVTVVLPAGSNTSGSDANLYLQAGQGAQVGVLTAGVVNVVFKEGDRTPGNHTTTSAMDNRLSSDNMLTVQLYTTDNYSNGGPTHDSFGIIFGDGLDNEITPTDAIKPMNFYENLGIDHNGTYLSIERREMPIPAETYPLYSSGYAHSNYTLKINIDGLEDTFLYLDDHFTGTTTLIEGGETVYAFSVSADDALSIATDRFSMRTEERLGVDNNSILAGVRLFPNPMKNDTFYIHAPKLNGEQISVSVSDLSGRQMFEKLLNCHSNMVTVSVNEDLSSGVYMVTLRHGGEESTYRLIKK